jgi:hypothetical protein
MKEEAYLKFLKDVEQINEKKYLSLSEANRIAGDFYQNLIDEVGEYVMDRFQTEEEQDQAANLILVRVTDLLKHRPH